MLVRIVFECARFSPWPYQEVDRRNWRRNPLFESTDQRQEMIAGRCRNWYTRLPTRRVDIAAILQLNFHFQRLGNTLVKRETLSKIDGARELVNYKLGCSEMLQTPTTIFRILRRQVPGGVAHTNPKLLTAAHRCVPSDLSSDAGHLRENVATRDSLFESARSCDANYWLPSPTFQSE